MIVRHRIFESSSKSWEQLAKETEDFASTIGRERLINISLAASGGQETFGFGGKGVLIVWYWE